MKYPFVQQAIAIASLMLASASKSSSTSSTDNKSVVNPDAAIVFGNFYTINSLELLLPATKSYFTSIIDLPKNQTILITSIIDLPKNQTILMNSSIENHLNDGSLILKDVLLSDQDYEELKDVAKKINNQLAQVLKDFVVVDSVLQLRSDNTDSSCNTLSSYIVFKYEYLILALSDYIINGFRRYLDEESIKSVIVPALKEIVKLLGKANEISTVHECPKNKQNELSNLYCIKCLPVLCKLKSCFDICINYISGKIGHNTLIDSSFGDLYIYLQILANIASLFHTSLGDLGTEGFKLLRVDALIESIPFNSVFYSVDLKESQKNDKHEIVKLKANMILIDKILTEHQENEEKNNREIEKLKLNMSLVDEISVAILQRLEYFLKQYSELLNGDQDKSVTNLKSKYGNHVVILERQLLYIRYFNIEETKMKKLLKSNK